PRRCRSRVRLRCAWHASSGRTDESNHAQARETRGNPEFASDLVVGYLAYSTVRTSRMTVTLISPGYVRSDSIFFEMSRAIFAVTLSSMVLASTITRTSRPAWMA